MVAEEVIITLSGGAPWGFRLQGGMEHQKPLQVAKVRKRSKACRAGLREADELVSINEEPCGSLSHAQAMNLIDSSPGILNILVRRAPAAFQSVVLVTRAPSPRIDKEYRAALKAMSPTQPHHAPVREVHRSRSSLTSGLTSPPGSEAYYGETDSDADVAGYERQRRQKRRSPSNSNSGKPPGRTSPEGGETSEMSGYDSAPDAQAFPRSLEGRGGNGDEGGNLPGVTRKEVVYKPPGPGMWSSQTSTETSSIISSADDQGPRDGGQEEDSGFLELANVPLVSPERAKEALMLGSRSQLVPMVGPVNKPIDEELTTTYMEKAKQAKLNRGDTLQDKQVKEAKSKCRTIASLLTDAPNPHSKGVLMFKKRRQRSKKYTLTSFGSVDEDRFQDSQEDDGVFPGSESEFDEEGFSGAPDPTWDSDYLDKLEKRATAGTEGREVGAENALNPGLSDTVGKGAQLFEQQRKRVDELAKKGEAAHSHAALESQVQEHCQMHPLHLEIPAQVQPTQGPQQSPSGPTPAQVVQSQIVNSPHAVPQGNLPNSTVSAVSMVMAPPPVAPKPATASVTVLSSSAPPPETPLPELPASNVLNRTARPFTPGFISIRAATAPVTFRPAVSKKTQRPASAAVVTPPFSTASDVANNTTPITSQQPPGPPPVVPLPYSFPKASLPLTPEAPVTIHTSALSAPFETMQSSPGLSGVHHSPLSTMTPVSVPSVPRPPQTASVPVPPLSQINGSPDPIASVPPLQVPVAPLQVPVAPLQVPVAQPPAPQVSIPSVTQESAITKPEAVVATSVPGPTGRTGILLEARRRSGKPKPMFNVPEVVKKSPNPDLLSLVQNLDERSTRHKYGQTTADDVYEEEESGEAGTGRVPPPVAPKPRVIHETPQILQAGGKGAQLFAKRQSRMGMYVVDTPPETPYQQDVAMQNTFQQFDSSVNSSHPSQWKYSPNVRAPPPIGYNPLLAPSLPTGPQKDTGNTDNKARGSSQKEGIKAVDFMKRQPYQLNSAMFQYGGSVTNLSAMPSYQAQQNNYTTTMVGSSLTSPRQIPLKTARVYEIKRFSTPTPMSAPTITPKVIAPRSATTLGERLTRSGMTSPPPVAFAPAPPQSVCTSKPVFSSSQPTRLPNLPKFSATPIPCPVPPSVPTPYPPASYSSGLQTAKQFQSAPELSILASLPPLKNNPVQAPKPHFVATRGGAQPHVWRPGAF
ncbi:PREDICTED: synaptopodin 2-like protein isoform X1 [Poecilia mexicana]|uniref:synaptopodin 2-like protein isoform X1 n=1 Tax=Poecilia mexicana TaxID=48701 RepID=UPI00072DE897|nr:PREDICTED: synaptopodin 2-like protein isoform X1 [Poecilia mexicana]